MSQPPLFVNLLAAPLIIRDFVKGIDGCNYENYLREAVNNSDWFLQKGEGLFNAPTSEFDGECDANALKYSIDFKLVASKTSLQAKSILSIQPVVAAPGVTFFCGSKEQGPMQATILSNALCGRSLEELKFYRASKCRKQGWKNDIKCYMKTLEFKKNLLLFHPVEFYYESPQPFDDGLRKTIEIINRDFGTSMQYRIEEAAEYDTYITYIYDGHFIFLMLDNGVFKLIDTVPTEKCPTFECLIKYTDW